MDENPCAVDCPERSGDCHGSCPKYKAYYQANRRKNAENYQAKEAERLAHEGRSREIRKRQKKPKIQRRSYE